MLRQARQLLGGGLGSSGAPIGVAVAVGIAYFLGARLSLALLTKPDGVAVFWPAAGISSGALIALGREMRLPVVAGVMIATIAANLLGDRNLLSSLVFALSNAVEATLAAWLIERQFGPGFDLVSLPRVLGLVGAAAIAAGVSGVGGTIGFVLFHGSMAPVLSTWSHWFASDALGIITVAPLVIGLLSAARHAPPGGEIIEGSVLLAALLLISKFIIAPPPEPWATAVPLGLLFPLLLWLAARCRPLFAAAAACIIALTVVWTITFGIGYFGDPGVPIIERILNAQLAILAATLCASVLAALFAQQRLHVAALNDSMTRLQEALTAGSVMAFEWDARTLLSQRSQNASRILGLDGQEEISALRFLCRIPPDDRARFKAHLYSVTPQFPSYVINFRYRHPNGQMLWLEEAAQGEFDAEGHCLRLKGLTRDISPRKRAEQHQDLLIKELDHRVKNMLARVAAVAMFTREGSGSMDEFIETLNGRIQSMAHTHALLSRGEWHGVGLADLIRHELSPYASGGNTDISGPDVALTAAASEATAMVLHELVTNAEKYGALSIRQGRVAICWNRENNGKSPASLKIEWREIGGPTVGTPTSLGYGANLIRNLVPHELGGTAELEFASDGVRCLIEIPPEHVAIRDQKGEQGLNLNLSSEPL